MHDDPQVVRPRDRLYPLPSGLTRRELIVLGGAAAASVLLPGCGGSSGPSTPQGDFFQASNV